MNYGRIISIISQASNVPVSDLMRMDNDQLRSTLEKAVQDLDNGKGSKHELIEVSDE